MPHQKVNNSGHHLRDGLVRHIGSETIGLKMFLFYEGLIQSTPYFV